MALNQRRVKILHLIREDGHAKVQDLSKIFNVTDVTIRQDLEALEQMGYIQREHGGVANVSKSPDRLSPLKA